LNRSLSGQCQGVAAGHAESGLLMVVIVIVAEVFRRQAGYSLWVGR